MAREGHSEDASQPLIRPTSLCLESQVKDGDDPHVPSGVKPFAHTLLKGSLLESMFDDGLLQKRKSIARPRLPSFRGLGISSCEEQTARDSHAPGTGYSPLRRDTVEHSYAGSIAPSAHRTGSTPLLTPPAELDPLKWNISAPTSPSAASAVKSSVMRPIEPLASRIEITCLSETGPPTENRSPETSGTGASEPHQQPTRDNTAQSSFENTGPNSWLDRAVGAAGKHLDPLMAYLEKCCC
jgi:hypothetical protein